MRERIQNLLIFHPYLLTSLLADRECNQETTHPTENNQHDMKEEDEKHGPNQEMDQ